MKILLIACAAIIPACAARPGSLTVSASDLPALRLMGRFASASACPIGPNLALTSAHVVDLAPMDRQAPLLPYRYDLGPGETGIADPAGLFLSADLASLKPRKPFTRWYPVAQSSPQAGDKVTWSGFDWGSPDRAYGDRTWEATVKRVRAGHVIVRPHPESGSSGSCVFNAAGEVVAVIAYYRPIGMSEYVGVAVGVWGEWLTP